jgi:cell division septal protein FtsQ
MWFRPKPKNRRVGREYVLDVKLRSSQVRAARTRLVAISLGTVFGAVFGAYLLWRGGQWALDRLVYENPAFAIEDVQIQTDGVIALEQLRRWSGVRTGDNLLALDLARVKRDLELVPLIQSVSAERILPRVLRIRVAEREPVAQASVPRPVPGGGVTRSLYQLDADGWVILPLESSQRSAPAAPGGDSMPEICGIDVHKLQPGHRIDAPPVQAALQLVVAFETSPMAGLVNLKSIDVTSPQVLVATTGQGSEVTFGLTDLDRQLRRWHDIFERAQRQNKVIATLDLAVTSNIPARFLDASAVPPENPRSPKPLRTRKNHV